MKILIVEDDYKVLDILVDLYNSNIKGYAEVATTCKKAIQSALKTKYDLISLDFLMPDGNGDEFVKKIRVEGGINKDTPILVVTGVSDLVQNKLKDQENIYITAKPFTRAKLIEKLEEILGPDVIKKN